MDGFTEMFTELFKKHFKNLNMTLYAFYVQQNVLFDCDIMLH
jgi:hypothetical protein